MHLLTYFFNNKESIGVLNKTKNGIYPLSSFGLHFNSMLELIEDLTPFEKEHLQKELLHTTKAPIPLCNVKKLAPIPYPAQDILCLGINYMEHAKESANYKKESFDGDHSNAIYFSKRVNEAVPDGEAIDSHQDIVKRLDYEVELAVIIGKDAKDVSIETAKDYIFGYSILNDVSARDIQLKHKQWYFGKSLDNFTPMGPWIATVDEFAFPLALSIQSYVNGELRQDCNTNQMIFDIPHILCELSKGMTLKAGTIIATGTPSGVGMGFDPPRFLKPGDSVTCSIEGIGSITNPVK